MFRSSIWPLCERCKCRQVPHHRRKYCDKCGTLASTLWKREKRKEWKNAGQRYWLDAWKHVSAEEKRRYFREYMRRYRRRRQCVLTNNFTSKKFQGGANLKIFVSILDLRVERPFNFLGF